MPVLPPRAFFRYHDGAAADRPNDAAARFPDSLLAQDSEELVRRGRD